MMQARPIYVYKYPDSSGRTVVEAVYVVERDGEVIGYANVKAFEDEDVKVAFKSQISKLFGEEVVIE